MQAPIQGAIQGAIQATVQGPIQGTVQGQVQGVVQGTVQALVTAIAGYAFPVTYVQDFNTLASESSDAIMLLSLFVDFYHVQNSANYIRSSPLK